MNPLAPPPRSYRDLSIEDWLVVSAIVGMVVLALAI